MTFNNSLSAESTWMTYFVQIALGYLGTWTVCALIQRPAVRLRLWRCFLFLTVASWLVLLAPAPGPAVGSSITSPIGGSSALRWSLPVGGGMGTSIGVVVGMDRAILPSDIGAFPVPNVREAVTT
jgi:hypothetical protein